MAAADLLVSKPGGLTTSEALARGLAIAVVMKAFVAYATPSPNAATARP